MMPQQCPTDPPKPRRKPSKRADSEAAILKACWMWLRARGVFTWRNNTGAMAMSDGGYLQYGAVGSPDLIGLLPDGRFLGIECKSPTGKQSDAQREFQRRIELSGGVYVLAHSVAEMEQRFGFLCIDISGKEC